MGKRVELYSPFNRFWHWLQAILIIILIATGFEIQGTFSLFGFETSLSIHNICALLLIILIAFAIFWHFVTGEWRQYVPTTKNVPEMILFYTVGIFKGEDHPVHKTRREKLNPLQRGTYFGLKIFLIPLQVGTGLLYYFYNELYKLDIWLGFNLASVISLKVIAYAHIIGAFLLLSFMIGHMYLTTTGHTIFSNIKAMIVGWEELDE